MLKENKEEQEDGEEGVKIWIEGNRMKLKENKKDTDAGKDCEG